MSTPPDSGWTKANQIHARKAGYKSWEAWILEREKVRGFPICGGRNRKQEPCGLKAGQGTDHLGISRCKMHGGNNPIGAGAGNYKHGRHSKAIPADILRARAEAEEDPKLLTLEKQIATGNVREERLLERLSELEELEANGKITAKDLAASRARVWDDIMIWADHKRRLVETETKLRVAHHDMVTRDRLRVLVDYVSISLQESVDEHITDDLERRRLLTSFAHKLRRFYLSPSPGGKNS